MSKTRYYIAIDPGVVSGTATYIEGVPQSFESKEWDDLIELARNVRSAMVFAIASGYEAVLITEKFQITSRTIKGKVFYESVYFNGWLSIEFPSRIEQTPAQGKGVSNTMLKAVGWYNPSPDGHANDAARHLMYRANKNGDFVVRQKLSEYLKSQGEFDVV